MPLTEGEMRTLDSVHSMFAREEQAYEEKRKDDAAFAKYRSLWEENRIKRKRASDAVQGEARRRKPRLKQIRESSRIQLPTLSVQQNSYGTSFKENISSTKRKIRSHTLGSRLHRKKEDARTVEEAGKVWEKTLQGRMKGLSGQPEGCSAADFQALCQFLTKDKGSNRILLPGQMQDGNLSQDQIKSCIDQYMGLDLGIDLRTDETVAKESVRLEELAGKTQAMRHLLDRHPEMTANLDEEEKQNLMARLDLGEQTADYYMIQKKVMTNSWYRTHYNSEITHRCRVGDTLEQRNLSLLLWQVEYMKNREAFVEDRTGRDWMFTYSEEFTPEEARIDDQAMNLLRQTPLPQEFGKNNAGIEDSRHADYFRARNTEGDPMYERLKNKAYYVAGEPNRMVESFARYLSNIPRLKAVQHMEKGQLQQMIENLVRTPVHMADPEEVEVCRQANLNGMRVYKEQLRKQINYLKRKYGNGFLLLEPEEFIKHRADYENDFTNMQGMFEFVSYLKKLPGMFDPDDPADQELDQWLNYYQNTALSDGYARNGHMDGLYRNFSEFKLGAMRLSMDVNATRKDMLKCADTLHLDVRWDTFFDEDQVLFDEVLTCIQYKPLSRMQEDAGSRRPSWNQLAPETKGMTRTEAADYFIQKEYAIAKETREFGEGQDGYLLTARNMLAKLDRFRNDSEGTARGLYDQLYQDVEQKIREHRLSAAR